MLEKIAKDSRIRLVAINYKDKPANAAAFLGEMGNPYAAIGVDQSGRTFIDWGAYGVPETFLVGPDGVIISKFIGALTDEAVKTTLEEQIQKALATAG